MSNLLKYLELSSKELKEAAKLLAKKKEILTAIIKRIKRSCKTTCKNKKY